MKAGAIWLAAAAVVASNVQGQARTDVHDQAGAAVGAVGAAAAALPPRVAAMLRDGSPGTRFGLLVVDDLGRPLVAINADQRFVPASNTKIATTAAAFALFAAGDALDRPDPAAGTAVRLETDRAGPPDVILVGHGDAALSGAASCASDCLATLADAVAARTRRVGAVIGDDSLYPDERWSPGMSWNNIPTASGTAVSALTIDDNELAMVVTPGPIGAAPTIALPPYYSVDNRAVTMPAGGAPHLDVDRDPNIRSVRLTGTIPAGAGPVTLALAIDDPAHYAAWQLARLLAARGVAVTGAIGVRHRPLSPNDDPATRGAAPAARPPVQPILAQLTPPPLADDLVRINRTSQNLHAELMLRRIGRVGGSGSIADGLALVRATLAQAGVDRRDYDLADGGGMSTYNRLTPRAAVTLLRWIAAQPWGARWRATLPVGGQAGTLGRRFGDTPLAGRIFAKTGTLNATNALAGYVVAHSGRTLTFAFYANDVPQAASATRVMDAVITRIAAAN